MNRISLVAIFLFAITICLVCSCANKITTSSYTAAAIDLSAYKTYAWVAPGDTALNGRRDDKIYAGLIQSTADKQLEKKGLTIDNQNPDAVFMFETKIDEKLQYRQTQINSNVGVTYGYGGFGYGYVGPGYYASSNVPIYQNEVSAVPIDEGTLSYAMYDRKTGKLLWKGVATQKLDAKTNIEHSIKSAASFIFAKLHRKK